jgi:hypothetical protein
MNNYLRTGGIFHFLSIINNIPELTTEIDRDNDINISNSSSPFQDPTFSDLFNYILLGQKSLEQVY